VSEPSTHDCDVPKNAQNTKKQCSTPTQSSIKSATPEAAKPQWGNRHSQQLPEKLEAVYGDLLDQAQAAANREAFQEAMQQVSGIPKNSRHYALAQQLQEDWVREVVRQATTACQQARVTEAIALLDSIPAASQVSAQASELRQRWSQQAEILKRAMAAKAAGDWQAAIDAVQALEGTPMYHSVAVQSLLQQAMTSLYEPDASLLDIAVSDLPAIEVGASAIKPPIAPPELLSLIRS
jgi:hypothetical protein